MSVFSQHPSQVSYIFITYSSYLNYTILFLRYIQLICSKSLELWSAFLNHHNIKTSQVLLSILPQLVKGLREKQLKVYIVPRTAIQLTYTVC